jgi:membrane protein implicated in regulation of membrane protease activity
MLGRSPSMRPERRILLTKRQMAFGVICFLVGLLVGIETAGDLNILVRTVIILALLLLCVYLALPYLPRRTRARRHTTQRMLQRKP